MKQMKRNKAVGKDEIAFEMIEEFRNNRFQSTQNH